MKFSLISSKAFITRGLASEYNTHDNKIKLKIFFCNLKDDTLDHSISFMKKAVEDSLSTLRASTQPELRDESSHAHHEAFVSSFPLKESRNEIKQVADYGGLLLATGLCANWNNRLMQLLPFTALDSVLRIKADNINHQ